MKSDKKLCGSEVWLYINQPSIVKNSKFFNVVEWLQHFRCLSIVLHWSAHLCKQMETSSIGLVASGESLKYI